MYGLPVRPFLEYPYMKRPKLQEEYGTFALKNKKNFVVMYGQTEATARRYMQNLRSCKGVKV